MSAGEVGIDGLCAAIRDGLCEATDFDGLLKGFDGLCKGFDGLFKGFDGLFSGFDRLFAATTCGSHEA